jgi:hypothetical protein
LLFPSKFSFQKSKSESAPSHVLAHDITTTSSNKLPRGVCHSCGTLPLIIIIKIES